MLTFLIGGCVPTPNPGADPLSPNVGALPGETVPAVVAAPTRTTADLRATCEADRSGLEGFDPDVTFSASVVEASDGVGSSFGLLQCIGRGGDSNDPASGSTQFAFRSENGLVVWQERIGKVDCCAEEWWDEPKVAALDSDGDGRSEMQVSGLYTHSYEQCCSVIGASTRTIVFASKDTSEFGCRVSLGPAGSRLVGRFWFQTFDGEYNGQLRPTVFAPSSVYDAKYELPAQTVVKATIRAIVAQPGRVELEEARTWAGGSVKRRILVDFSRNATTCSDLPT